MSNLTNPHLITIFSARVGKSYTQENQ